MLRSMKNVTTNNMQTDETVEELLVAAGFDFTVVERCPEPNCHLCNHADLPVAA